jgi:hypothetical protein
MRKVEPEFEAMLNGVELENGAPIAVSEYGWKVIEINGKKYLSPATKEERDKSLADLGLSVALRSPNCVSDNYGACLPVDGCTTGCRKVQKDPFIYHCYCA